jgi:hypothetical protein
MRNYASQTSPRAERAREGNGGAVATASRGGKAPVIKRGEQFAEGEAAGAEGPPSWVSHFGCGPLPFGFGPPPPFGEGPPGLGSG